MGEGEEGEVTLVFDPRVSDSGLGPDFSDFRPLGSALASWIDRRKAS